jgi:hypothetical protein
MFIVPLFPALFANRLLADWTSHSRCSACLPPLLCTQFNCELHSVTHPAITPRYHPKTHPHAVHLFVVTRPSATFCAKSSCQNQNALLEEWVSQSMWWWILKWYYNALIRCPHDDVCWESEHYQLEVTPELNKTASFRFHQNPSFFLLWTTQSYGQCGWVVRPTR